MEQWANNGCRIYMDIMTGEYFQSIQPLNMKHASSWGWGKGGERGEMLFQSAEWFTLLDIMKMENISLRFIGEEYKGKNYTGWEEFPNRTVYNKRRHNFYCD